MTHKMILATADLSKIYKVVVATRKASETLPVECSTRNADEPVRLWSEAPQSSGDEDNSALR